MSWKSAPSSSRLSASASSPSSRPIASAVSRDPARVRVTCTRRGLERVRERLDGREERPLERLEAGGVLDRELGLVREAAEQLELALPGVATLGAADRDQAPAAWSKLNGATAIRARGSGRRRREGRVLLRSEQIGPGGARRSRSSALRRDTGARPTELVLVADRGDPDEVAPVCVLQPERRLGRPEDARRSCDDAVERRPEARPPARAPGRTRAGRGRSLPRAARLVETRVLERDRRVPGEHLDQADVVLVELVDSELRDHDHADHARADAERDGDDRLLDRARFRRSRPRTRTWRRPASSSGSPCLGDPAGEARRRPSRASTSIDASEPARSPLERDREQVVVRRARKTRQLW